MILGADDIEGPLQLAVDVCVVGAGSGGAVVTDRLTAAGLSVALLEVGSRRPPGGHAGATSEASIRAGYLHDRGYRATADRSAQLLQARMLGGGAALAGGPSELPPVRVLERWAGASGLALFDVDGVLAAAAELGLPGPAGDDEARAAEPLDRVLGARAAGARAAARGPRQPGRVAGWIERASGEGARVVCDVRVDRVRVEDGAAIGVDGYRLERGAVDDPVRIDADAVVLAAGAIHTPALLMWSRVPNRSRRLGLGLRLQPTAPLLAPQADDAALAALAARLQGELDGALVRPAAWPAGLAASFTPLLGQPLRDGIAAAGRCPGLAVSLCDTGEGWVVPLSASHAVSRWELSPRDRGALSRAMTTVAAAAAEQLPGELWTSHLRPTRVDRGAATSEGLGRRGYRSCELALYSTGPLGTCPAGARARRAVTGEGGRVHGVDGLYVADASLLPDAPGVYPAGVVAALARRVADEVAGSLGRRGG